MRRVVESILLRLTGATWFTPSLGDPEKYPMPKPARHYVPFVMMPQASPEERPWFGNGHVNLLHVGKFVPGKKHRLFLEAISRLYRRFPLRATIVGECSTPAHRAELDRVTLLRARLELDGIVDIETNVPHLAMGELYASHDVLVVCSGEVVVVSPLEAMAHSLPVVCSDDNGVIRYLRRGENGLVFRSGDVGDLEACIESMIEDRDRLVSMGRRSYELVITEHAPRRYVDVLVEMAGGER